MIIFLNGPFGVGKTTTARLLAERIPGAVVYDPEQIGFVLRILRPVYRVADYQDLRLWRRLAIWGAWLQRRVRRRHLIVPMAVLRADYFAELAAGFRAADPDVRCIRLTATEETLRHRILQSNDRGAAGWRLAHTASGLAAVADPTFGVAVPTDQRTPTEVADAVCLLLRHAAGRCDGRFRATQPRHMQDARGCRYNLGWPNPASSIEARRR
jgi:hypothetical protein